MEKSLKRLAPKSSSRLVQFVAKWEQAFGRIKRKTYNQDAWWQGSLAFEELWGSEKLCVHPAAELLMFPSKHHMGHDHFRAMFREIESYKRNILDLQASTINYEEVVSALRNYERKFKSERKRSVGKNLKKIWQDCAAFVRKQRIHANGLLRRRWSLALESPTRTDWVRSDLTSHTSPLFPHWDTIFSMAKYPKLSRRITELDARLQIRLATIFWFGLPFASLRTISRLVLLAYWCGNLGEVQGSSLLVNTRGKFLSVNAIYKRLKAAGLERLTYV
jgi:hypothetical protein